eukprot:Opistho-2@67587
MSRKANLSVDLSGLSTPPATQTQMQTQPRARKGRTITQTHMRPSAVIPGLGSNGACTADLAHMGTNTLLQECERRLFGGDVQPSLFTSALNLPNDFTAHAPSARKSTKRPLVQDDSIDSLASLTGASSTWSADSSMYEAIESLASLSSLNALDSSSLGRTDMRDELRTRLSEHAPCEPSSMWASRDKRRRISEENLERKRKQTFLPKELVREYCEKTKCEVKALTTKPPSHEYRTPASAVKAEPSVAAHSPAVLPTPAADSHSTAVSAPAPKVGGRRRRNAHATAEERALAKRERNRVAAKNLRARKRELKSVLEFHEDNLTQGNVKLQSEIEGLRTELATLANALASHSCSKKSR